MLIIKCSTNFQKYWDQWFQYLKKYCWISVVNKKVISNCIFERWYVLLVTTKLCSKRSKSDIVLWRFSSWNLNTEIIHVRAKIFSFCQKICFQRFVFNKHFLYKALLETLLSRSEKNSPFTNEWNIDWVSGRTNIIFSPKKNHRKRSLSRYKITWYKS